LKIIRESAAIEHVTVADAWIQASLLGEAVDNGPVAVFVADENREYVAVNRAACALLGYSREELLAMRVDDVADTSAWTEMEVNGQLVSTAELRRKDGSTVVFSYTAGATVVAGMPVFVSVGV
jgi:PAS domain S-box-containing protein